MAQRKDHNLENRRGTWHFVVKKKGRKIKLSLKTTSVTEARKLRDEMLRRHLNGEDLRGSEKPENRTVLFGEIAQR